jgi:hypothetical protein
MGGVCMSVAQQSKTRKRTSNKRHSDLTDAEKRKFGAPHIGTLFSELNTELNEIWEDFKAINFYLLKVHELTKLNSIERVAVPRLVSKPRMEQLSPSAVYGIISRIKDKTAGRHAFIDAISAFEHFISMLVFKVYLDFPQKLRGLSRQLDTENVSRQQKLIDIIFDSADRYEMLHKLIEEKVRSIFYGNPIDLFSKDKALIEFGTHFKKNKSSLLVELAEIIARRNIIMHNHGRVDRKYLNEVAGASLKLGQKAVIDEQYLKRALLVMKELAADAGQLVATNIYKEPLFGRAKRVQDAAMRKPLK